MLNKPVNLFSQTSRRGASKALRGWVLLAVALTLPAAEYAVATTGSDSNPGTLAAPWATVQRAETMMQAGDICTIRGGTYREQVTPTNSGTATAPITFRSFPGEQVVISGVDQVSDSAWTSHTGNIYRTTTTLPVATYSDQGFLANQVFVNGVMMTEARWPNNVGSLTVPTLAGGGISDGEGLNSTVANNDIPILADWDGATVWGNEWFISRAGTITGGNGGPSGALTAVMTASIFRGDYWFYLSGKLGLLDAAKEWFYDNSSHTLSLWAPAGGAPVGVEVKRRNFAFDLSGRSYISLLNVNIFAATITTSDASQNIVIDGLQASYISHHVTLPEFPSAKRALGADGLWILSSHADDTGIMLRGTGNILRNSTIAFSSGNGVWLEGSGLVVENYTIHDVNYQSSYAAAVFFGGLNSRNHRILHNTMYRSGKTLIDAGYHLCGPTLNGIEIAYNNLS